jgi:drug/metabolite transporter (DMT)-like permease
MGSEWVIFALLSAILTSIASIAEKKTLFRQHALEFATTVAIYNFILSIPFWFLADWSSLSLGTVGLIYLTSLIGSIAFLLVTKSLRHIAISITSPFLVLEPLFVAILAAIILGEKITFMHVTGMMIIIIGAYLLSSHEHDHLLEPFKHIFKSKYIRYILFALILYAFTSILDKRIVGAEADGGLGITVWTYILLVHFFLAINFILMTIIFGYGIKGLENGVKTGGWLVFAIAALTIGYRLSYQYAISLPGVLVSLVIPIKKLSSFFSTLIGGELFHEKHVLRKSLACLVMIIGAILILM